MKASVWFVSVVTLSSMIAACETPADSSKGADAASSANTPTPDAAVVIEQPKPVPAPTPSASTPALASASAGAVPADAGVPDAAVKTKSGAKK